MAETNPVSLMPLVMPAFASSGGTKVVHRKDTMHAGIVDVAVQIAPDGAFRRVDAMLNGERVMTLEMDWVAANGEFKLRSESYSYFVNGEFIAQRKVSFDEPIARNTKTDWTAVEDVSGSMIAPPAYDIIGQRIALLQEQQPCGEGGGGAQMVSEEDPCGEFEQFCCGGELLSVALTIAGVVGLGVLSVIGCILIPAPTAIAPPLYIAAVVACLAGLGLTFVARSAINTKLEAYLACVNANCGSEMRMGNAVVPSRYLDREWYWELWRTPSAGELPTTRFILGKSASSASLAVPLALQHVLGSSSP